jgi:hypothetical protein
VRSGHASRCACWRREGHNCLNHGDARKTLYFFPWLELEWKKEFRKFVFENGNTTPNAQMWFRKDVARGEEIDGELGGVMNRIIACFNG